MRKTFLLINLLVLVGSIFVGIWAYNRGGQYFAPGVIYVAPGPNGRAWTAAEVADLHWQLPDYLVSGAGRGSVLISSGTHQVFATALYSCEGFFTVNFTQFTQGTRWEGFHSIVLNENLAWRLFGSLDVVGRAVELGQTRYTVAGVVGHSEGYMAWLPQVGGAVSSLYMQPAAYNPVNVMADISGANGMFARQGRFPGNYFVVDITRYIEAMFKRVQVFLCILWLIAIVIFAKMAKTRRRYGLILPILGILLATGALYISVNEILYWLPNMALPGASLLDSFTNANTLPSGEHGLVRLAELNRFANIAWIVGAVALVNIVFVKPWELV